MYAWFTKKIHLRINLSMYLYPVALLSLATPVFISGSQKSRQSTHARYSLDGLDTYSSIAIKLRACATLPLNNTIPSYSKVHEVRKAKINIKHQKIP